MMIGHSNIIILWCVHSMGFELLTIFIIIIVRYFSFKNHLVIHAVKLYNDKYTPCSTRQVFGIGRVYIHSGSVIIIRKYNIRFRLRV